MTDIIFMVSLDKITFDVKILPPNNTPYLDP